MFRNLKRITIFTGHFGSGKTELAINFTLKLAEDKKKVVIVDLDIVNPYFRSREVKDILEAKGIKVISPAGNLHHADVPALSSAILVVLQNQDYHVVLDVGGDDVGATVLGRFKENLPEGSYNMFCVVNSYRPFTQTVTGINNILTKLESASRLKITALVSNGNLGYETDKNVIINGYKVSKAAAENLNLPIAFVGIRENIYEEIFPQLEFLFQDPVLKVKLFMLPPWFETEQL